MPHEVTETVSPRNVVIVANEAWEDDDVQDIGLSTDLGPGDEEVMARVESTDPEVSLAVHSLATTTHPHDFDTDGISENAVRYRYEHIINVSDEYNSVPGMTTTLPQGDIGKPIEPVPGAAVGPVKGFRIVFENRTDGTADPITIDQDRLGAELHARVMRRGHGGDD